MSSSDSKDDDRSQTASVDSFDSKTSSASGGGEKANGTHDPAERNAAAGTSTSTKTEQDGRKRSCPNSQGNESSNSDKSVFGETERKEKTSRPSLNIVASKTRNRTLAEALQDELRSRESAVSLAPPETSHTSHNLDRLLTVLEEVEEQIQTQQDEPRSQWSPLYLAPRASSDPFNEAQARAYFAASELETKKQQEQLLHQLSLSLPSHPPYDLYQARCQKALAALSGTSRAPALPNSAVPLSSTNAAAFNNPNVLTAPVSAVASSSAAASQSAFSTYARPPVNPTAAEIDNTAAGVSPAVANLPASSTVPAPLSAADTGHESTEGSHEHQSSAITAAHAASLGSPGVTTASTEDGAVVQMPVAQAAGKECASSATKQDGRKRSRPNSKGNESSSSDDSHTGETKKKSRSRHI